MRLVVKCANAMHCMRGAARWAVRQISGLLSDYLEGITEQNLQVRRCWTDVDILDYFNFVNATGQMVLFFFFGVFVCSKFVFHVLLLLLLFLFLLLLFL